MNLSDLPKFAWLRSKSAKEVLIVLWLSFLILILFRNFPLIFPHLASHLQIQEFIQELSNSVLYIPFITLVYLTLCALCFWFINKIHNFSPLPTTRRILLDQKNISQKILLKDFDFQGQLINKDENDERCLFLTRSTEGLLTKKNFNNPQIMFRAKIKKRGFGFIVGAHDFENYVMFRFMYGYKESNEGFYIVPHIRKYGIWDVQDSIVERNNAVQIPEGEMLNFNIITKDRRVLIMITGHSINKNFLYLIPSHFPLRKVKNDKEVEENVVESLDLTSKGKVGFRAAHDEVAAVYQLDVKG